MPFQDRDLGDLFTGVLKSNLQGKPALFPKGILIDLGMADKFLPDQPYPDVFEAAYRCAGQPLELSRARHAKNSRAT